MTVHTSLPFTCPETQAILSKDRLTVTLSGSLLRRLRIGDRPSPEQSVDEQAVWEVAQAIGLDHEDDWWNLAIDWLDANYPSWRGWEVVVWEVAA